MRIPRLLRLLLRPPALDFEQAAWELAYLVIKPRRVYKSIYYRQQTKNQWARDDPSFIILLSSLISSAAIVWGLTHTNYITEKISVLLNMVFVDFLVIGALISTILYFFANKFLRKSDQMSLVALEWGYCFDVHCNSFVVVFLYLYVVQLIALPVLTRHNWFSVFFGNLLYLAAFVHYCIITFLGYSMLPILKHQEIILAPIPFGFIVWLILTLCKVSLTNQITQLYFDEYR